MRRVHHGDCLDIMAAMDAASVDAIVSDPPYGLAFMGKGWDHAVPGADYWREALRVAKPGAHLMAFGGTRTFHRLACAIEDAGWEMRDTLSWLHGSGFPKSHNGPWGGTALKPAWEPIIIARKPLAGTVAANVTAHGTGALNVDGCRIAASDGYTENAVTQGINTARTSYAPAGARRTFAPSTAGRWPANVVLDEDAAAVLGEPSRFFYCAKASRREREAGTDGNGHPTVKPLALMRWLVRLATPPAGVVFDPFTGSGTTGCAAVLEGMRFVGIEREAEYVAIAERRIAHWFAQCEAGEPALDLFEQPDAA